jgi:hypothetical protein
MAQRILRRKLDENMNMIHIHRNFDYIDFHLITDLTNYFLAAFAHLSNQYFPPIFRGEDQVLG